MANSEFRIDELIEECTCILEGDYADDEKAHIDALMCELSGFRFQLHCTMADSILSKRTREGVMEARGWLRANMGTLSGQPTKTTITNSSQSSACATVSVTMSQVIKVIGSSDLSQESKDALELEMSRLRTAAEDKDEKGFAEKLAKALEIAKDAVGLVPAVAQAAGTLAGML